VNAPVNSRVVQIKVADVAGQFSVIQPDQEFCIITSDFLTRGGDKYDFSDAVHVETDVRLDIGKNVGRNR